MTACRCNEPLEPGHRCWATQAAELEALREVERAARAVERNASHTNLDLLAVALAKLDEVRR